MDIYDVVKKLLGPIDAIGETSTDSNRYENLQKTIYVTNKLLFDISSVLHNKNRQEHSMKKIGESASKFFDELGIEEFR